MELKVIISKERAEELLKEMYAMFKITGNTADDLSGVVVDEEKYNMIASMEKTIIQGFMFGLLNLNTSGKSLDQKLETPLVLGEANQKILSYRRTLKGYQLLSMSGNKGKEPEFFEKLEALTDVSKKLLGELSGFDFVLSGAVATLFLS